MGDDGTLPRRLGVPLRRPARDRTVYGVALGALALLEIGARGLHGPAPSEVAMIPDALCAALVVLFVLVAHALHPLAAFRRVRRFGLRRQRAARRARLGLRIKRAMVLSWGFELRRPQHGPAPMRIPRAHLVLTAVGVVACAIAWLDGGRWLGPGAWAAWVGGASHALRALVLAGWWSLSTLCLLAIAAAAMAGIRFGLRRARPAAGRQTGIAAALLVLLLAFGLSGNVAAWAVVALVPVAVLAAWRRPQRPPLVARDRHGEVRYRVPAGYADLLLAESLAILGVLVLAVFGATGPHAGEHLVGAWLGRALAWALVVLGAAYLYAQDSLVPRGWPHALQFDRVAEMRLRYALLRGLERAVRAVEGRSFRSGEGLLIGVQYWFVPGLLRDVTGPEPEEAWPDGEQDGEQAVRATGFGIVGPPFDEVLSAEARENHRRVMDALDLDLVFVEDGVGWDALERVLLRAFRIYDESNGGRRAEERDFVALPAVEVAIVAIGHEPPPVRSLAGFDEPEYDELGTARLLVVRRDRRSPDDAEPEVPETSDHRPLVGVGV
jgi:hypothetical protein